MTAVHNSISKALETRLAAIAEPLPTQWENSDFSPVEGQPYQEAYVLYAAPENPTLGDDFWRQRGYLQVSLRFPANTGKAAVFERAGQIAAWFKRGLSLEADGITTVIERTPEVTNGTKDGDRFVVNVKARFYADIQP